MSNHWFRSDFATWVGTLSAEDESNWDVCVDRALWGSGSNSARGVRVGDELVIWKAKKGWFARCVVTTPPRQPTERDPAPWEDGREYTWMFGIRPIKQLEIPFNPGSENNWQKITNIPNVRLSQFPKLKSDQASAVRTFFGLANPPKTDADVILDELDDAHERALQLRNPDSPREVAQLVKARRGQGVFRSNLEQIEKYCRITGLRSTQHLRASHIKPWRVSDDFEKIDGHNGLLLSPHCDHLFDRGWVMFDDDGHLVPSTLLDHEVLTAWRIEPPADPQPFLPEQIEYLEYHREMIFQKS